MSSVDIASATELSCRQTVHLLYSDHHRWLQGWLRSKLGNAADAFDLTQDTFVRVLSAQREEVLPDLREPRAYLTTVARRLLLNHFRRRSLERAYLDALALLPEPQVPSAEHQLQILETLQQVDAALDALPAHVRQAFLLAQIEGLGYAEIATRLAVSERSIKRYVAQGLTQCLLVMA